MYNPAIHSPNAASNGKTRPDRYINLKPNNKAAVSNYLGANLSIDQGKLTKTNFGLSTSLCASTLYSVNFLAINAATTLGQGYNETGERTVIVQKGNLFIEVEGDMLKLVPGNTFFFAKGVKHALATSGDGHCEFICLESPDYDKGWITITKPVYGGVEITVPARTLDEPKLVHKDIEKGKEQARLIQARKPKPKITADGRPTQAGRMKEVQTANSGASIGANPTPEIPDGSE